jgi:hypothetical protein
MSDGVCVFSDFAIGLITNSTTPTALPSTDLGAGCVDYANAAAYQMYFQ